MRCACCRKILEPACRHPCADAVHQVVGGRDVPAARRDLLAARGIWTLPRRVRVLPAKSGCRRRACDSGRTGWVSGPAASGRCRGESGRCQTRCVRCPGILKPVAPHACPGGLHQLAGEPNVVPAAEIRPLPCCTSSVSSPMRLLFAGFSILNVRRVGCRRNESAGEGCISAVGPHPCGVASDTPAMSSFEDKK